jgi:hypothetical protein
VSGNALNIGSNNDLIANNIFAWPNVNSQGGSSFIVSEANNGYGGTYLTIANNIFLQTSPNKNYVLKYWTPLTGWSVKNNILVGARMWDLEQYDSGAIAVMGGNNYGRIDCEHSEVNPLFISAVKGSTPYNFALQAGSPAINTGTNVGLTTDYLGNAIMGVPDIGAYEYQPVVTTYYNVLKSDTTTRNNCGNGYAGSVVTYAVPAGKYTSTVSQAEADDLALADVAANKQSYANTYGTCILIPVETTYYNTQVSGIATRNNCSAGYIGSTVIYVVPAGKYSSTVSQADADSKATQDLANNKQSYANTYGTCTAVKVYYNTRVSASATRNNCPSGKRGTMVTYTVPAKKYSSTISQADAQSKATADLSANKQDYANRHGYCR